ncbi:MAG: hypothetical protein WCI54_06195 [Bacteroidia bacterium]
MTERKLSPEQIDNLFEFCREHYVNQYDLQIELVDHIASSIEEQWETDSKLSFQEALNKTFGKFGIFGFGKIKDRKEKELRRKYSRLLFQYLIDFYKWPKALLTFALTILLYLIFRLTNEVQIVTVSLSLVVCISVIGYHVYFFEKFFEVKTTPKKSFLILDYMKSRQIMVSGMYQLSWLIGKIVSDLDNINHPEIEFALAFFLVGFILILYIYFFVVPQKIREHFTEQFPQFIMS